MYIDSYFDQKSDVVHIIERANGKRIFKEVKPDHHFYIDDPTGSHKSIFYNNVKKISPRSYGEKKSLISKFSDRKIYESDTKPVFRVLEDNYLGCDIPKLNIAFFDIETDFDKVRGYSEPSEAANPITSITLYLEWMEAIVCLAVPPKGMSRDEALEIAEQVGDTIIFHNEKDMLDSFIDLIDDADALSGWNSDVYDITYTVNRIVRLMGKSELRRLSPWNLPPKPKSVIRGGREVDSYEIPGKLSLDYMELYKNYNFEQKQSYKLDSIAEEELGERKVEYDGTLDQLYNNDFKKFLEYNIKDTMLVYRLDVKLGFIDLCNTYAHTNCVLLPTVMGTVSLIDQAVTIEAHSRGMVVPDRKMSDDDTRAAGGWVANPKKGLHRYIGSTDLTSLYPSVIRALNMSPETIVGQVDLTNTYKDIARYLAEAKKHKFTMWWNDRFCPLEMDSYFECGEDDKPIKLRMESGEVLDITISDLRKLIKEGGQPWIISANGTIFRHDIVGVIPSLLTRWFKERKQLQRIEKLYSKFVINEKEEGFVVPDDIDLVETNVERLSPFYQENTFSTDKFNELVDSKDGKALSDYIKSRGMYLDDNRKLIYHDQKEAKIIIDFWGKRQLIRKLALNSTYGALLNAGSRFFDIRLGQSTTLTGRNITKHMAAKTNEILCGVYDHYGDACVYGDTDSVYFKPPSDVLDMFTENNEVNKDLLIDFYDKLGEDVSDSFSEMLFDKFNVPLEMSTGIIKSDREIVSDYALFIKKKRYAAMVIDKEGSRQDINGKRGKLKVMGLDLRRSDTPKFMQDFLSEILTKTLTDHTEDQIIERIREFKKEFMDKNPWEMGSPKSVNNLTLYHERREKAMSDRLEGKSVKLTVPGHVTASFNWNYLRDLHGDREVSDIKDGQRIVVCKLKKTRTNTMESIAYPVDETRIPSWFKDLPFDTDAMLDTIVNKKIHNLLSVLKWDLNRATQQAEDFENFFKKKTT